MDNVEIVAVVLVWLLVVGVALMRVPGGGGRALIVPWIALTALSMAVLFIVLFIATYGVLFFIGKEAATVSVILSAIILAATPVVWAVVLRRRAHGAATQG